VSGSRNPAIHIFVSHSHADDEFGIRLVQDLRVALGEEDAVWYDSSGGLQGGDAWWARIRHELGTRPLVLVVTSPDAMASPWVNSEIDVAWKQHNSPQGKTIIPVLYRPCKLRADLSTLPVVSFLPPIEYAKGLSTLLAAIRDPARLRSRRTARAARPLFAALAGAALAVLVVSMLLIVQPLLGSPSDGALTPATRTAQAFSARETALATTTPSAIANEDVAYHTMVPGPCAHDAYWTFDGDPNVESYTCQPDGLHLVAKGLDTATATQGVAFHGRGGTFPEFYTVMVDVRALSPSACVSFDVYYQIDTSDHDDYYLQACDDGNLIYEVLTSPSSHVFQQGGIGPLGSSFTISFALEASGLTVKVGPTFQTTVTDHLPPSSARFSYVSFAVVPPVNATGSATFTNFHYTPAT
jgi:hypothetical protein